jgi:hypothetical protein
MPKRSPDRSAVARLRRPAILHRCRRARRDHRGRRSLPV